MLYKIYLIKRSWWAVGKLVSYTGVKGITMNIQNCDVFDKRSSFVETGRRTNRVDRQCAMGSEKNFESECGLLALDIRRKRTSEFPMESCPITSVHCSLSRQACISLNLHVPF